jgi:hypothetical protein
MTARTMPRTLPEFIDFAVVYDDCRRWSLEFGMMSGAPVMMLYRLAAGNKDRCHGNDKQLHLRSDSF